MINLYGVHELKKASSFRNILLARDPARGGLHERSQRFIAAAEARPRRRAEQRRRDPLPPGLGRPEPRHDLPPSSPISAPALHPNLSVGLFFVRRTTHAFRSSVLMKPEKTTGSTAS